jgi:hypothetical protein
MEAETRHAGASGEIADRRFERCGTSRLKAAGLDPVDKN